MKKMSRNTKKLWVYLSIGVGTVALAFFCVFLSLLLYRSAEDSLYNQEHYSAINIVSIGTIGEPLELSTRLGIFDECEVEGDERLPLPAEITEAAAVAIARSLWNEILLQHADSEGILPSGDLVSDLLSKTRVTAVLRDFYNLTSEVKLALWSVQVYCDSAVEDATYCLSIQLDSLTGEPYTISCALFSNILPENNQDGIEAFCTAIGMDADASGATVEDRENGTILRLTLSNGMIVQKTCYFGEQFEIILINPI
ncbi:MAG: hypothetical protein Q4C04_07035 [Clostridia bacterium]|nr:hypothetical protein [Clostridia bacterium]